jgi:hypothetical protein
VLLPFINYKSKNISRQDCEYFLRFFVLCRKLFATDRGSFLEVHEVDLDRLVCQSKASIETLIRAGIRYFKGRVSLIAVVFFHKVDHMHWLVNVLLQIPNVEVFL